MYDCKYSYLILIIQITINFTSSHEGRLFPFSFRLPLWGVVKIDMEKRRRIKGLKRTSVYVEILWLFEQTKYSIECDLGTNYL